MKCPVCDYKVKKEFVYCPMCAAKLDKKEPILVTTERLQYLWERWDKSKFLDSNFRAFRNMARFPYMKVDVIRTQLGDFSHINLLNLQIFSFLFSNPKYGIEFYRIGKLLGFHTGATALKAGKVDNIVNLINKTGLFWKVFENSKVREVYVSGWERLKAGKSRWVDTNRDKGMVRIIIDESPSISINSAKPSCMWLCGVHCGHMGALFDGIWKCVETKCVCVGDPRCEFEVRLCETDEDVDIPMFSKNEADKILNSLIEDVINQRGTYRKDLGDFYHIGVNQYMNYFLMALSEGHAILSKHSGFLCGERIAEKANLSDQESALDYACDLFLYLKAGILHEPEVEGNHIIMRMDESVFASGVSNINMKLDVFLTGIIEGMLNKATDEKWQVEETKCIANGDDYCEFRCRQV